MDIKYFMPLWGNEHMPLHELFSKIKDEGYDGIEMQVPTIPKDAGRLKELLRNSICYLLLNSHCQQKWNTTGLILKRCWNV